MRSAFTDEYKAVLKMLVDARQAAGLTQQQLAGALRKPQSFVSKYERGERRLDVVEFIWIARALQAEPAKMIRRLERDFARLRPY